jgi:hypothetical protein
MIIPAIVENAKDIASEFENARPFRHVVIDDLLKPHIAERMLKEFPVVDDPSCLFARYGFLLHLRSLRLR